MYIYIYIYRSGGIDIMGYVVPGCVEYGAWILWGNSSAAAMRAGYGLDKVSEKNVMLSQLIDNHHLGTYNFNICV